MLGLQVSVLTPGSYRTGEEPTWTSKVPTAELCAQASWGFHGLFLFMCMHLCEYVYSCSERVSGALKLELHVGCDLSLVSSGNQTQTLYQTAAS